MIDKEAATEAFGPKPKPKRRRLKMAAPLVDCARCGHGHTDWWKSTAPPGCEERRIRGL